MSVEQALIGIGSFLIIGLLGVIGYFLVVIHGDLRTLTKAFNDFALTVPRDYALKVDLTDLERECRDDHRRIHGRIDGIKANGQRGALRLGHQSPEVCAPSHWPFALMPSIRPWIRR